MPTYYIYKIIKKDKIIGEYSSIFPIYGTYLSIPISSVFKQQYSKKLETIKLSTSYMQIDYKTIEIVLNATKKSKRQLEILKNLGYING